MDFDKKKKMSEEERLRLARKLDEDLDCFMEQLAAKKKNEPRKPFNFDEWCKDLEQHPAFMTELKPDAKGEYSEAVQALQALKYAEGSSEEERIDDAEHHKEEGNKYFKFKKYRWASDCYTNGIKVMCKNRKLNSVLYANRAAAQKHLSNIRSALRDCVFARKFDPSNCKAVTRGAECLIELDYGQQCLDWIESSRLQMPKKDKDDKAQEAFFAKLLELEKKAKHCQLLEAKNARKNKLVEKKDIAAKKRLLNAFSNRHLKFKPPFSFDSPEVFEWSQIEVFLPQTQSHQLVSLDDNDVLLWPLLIQYPEFGQVDFLKECSEESELGQVLDPIFQEAAEWDLEHSLRPDNVRYFITLDVYDENEVFEVYSNDTLKFIFSTKDYVITQGLPVVQVYLIA
uniref:Wheel domain-containing protein n=1 Tax=Syphacia muris TaxID=451379 RepID=A0A0N5AJE4_9BILA